MRHERIAAVVVTYNRKNLLGDCLAALLGQSHPLDAIYIIDNHSTDGSYDLLLERKLIAPLAHLDGQAAETLRPVPLPGCPDRRIEVRYVRLPENTGGAGGFHEGVKRAVQAGFDWLWLMDDDVRAAPDALQVLVQKKEALAAQGGRPFLLNSLVLATDADGDTLAFPLQEFTASGKLRRGVQHWRLSAVRGQVRAGLYRWICPFNGTFLPARATVEIGLPNREFYIWGDERDFFWRAARKCDLYTVVASRVFHPRAPAGAFDWRQYYLLRNTFVINRHFRFAALRNFRLILVSLARGLRHGRAGLRLVCPAIRDGLAGRLGKRNDIGP
jgi:rhamnopyranosyl-N-acetylglucosaminyl-diphospho-decaprenol beta-1,3/1,4-galactofuranosyltransferase